MQKQFYVAQNGEQVGPFSLEEILKKLDTKSLDLNDYLYDEATHDWVVLMAYPALSEKMKAMKPALPPKKAHPGQVEQQVSHKEARAKVATGDSKSVEWFVLKGDSKFGPFAYVDLIKMLQDKSVFEYDYVWHTGMAGWMRIAETGEFQPETIRKLKNSNEVPQLTEIFFRRRHGRVSHGGSLLVHDNRNVWKGQSLEISGGGAGIIVENAMIKPGQTLFLHFKPCDGLPSFNSVCEVVSKQFVHVNERNSPVRYGVKFKELNSHTEKVLADFTNLKRKAS